MRRSRTLEKLRRNEPVLVISPSLTPTAKVMEIAGMVGFDCAWLDTEHRDFTTDDLYPALLAARLHDIDTVVRIRKQDYGDYFRPLELGATGIMVPHVMSAEEARWAVRNAKFAPEGLRGLDAAGPDARFLDVEAADYCREANRETFVCLQIEDRQAVEEVESIAAVPGVDILFVGPADLAQSYGVPFQFEHKRLEEATARVAKAAAANGIAWGMPAGAPEKLVRCLEMGARFVAVGSDVRALWVAWRQLLGELRAAAGGLLGA